MLIDRTHLRSNILDEVIARWTDGRLAPGRINESALADELARGFAEAVRETGQVPEAVIAAVAGGIGWPACFNAAMVSFNACLPLAIASSTVSPSETQSLKSG